MNTEAYTYQFVGGNLALDFVNTVAYRFHPEKMQDHLQSAEDACRWASQAGLLDRRVLKSGIRLNGRALRRLRAVREELFGIFHAAARGEAISVTALRHVGRALNECRGMQRLSRRGREIRWIWRPGVRGVDLLLYPILTAATELLTSTSRRLIRQCGDVRCGWLFLDRSNARKRRWCRMADCGNRNKARVHYRRIAV